MLSTRIRLRIRQNPVGSVCCALENQMLFCNQIWCCTHAKKVLCRLNCCQSQRPYARLRSRCKFSGLKHTAKHHQLSNGCHTRSSRQCWRVSASVRPVCVSLVVKENVCMFLKAQQSRVRNDEDERDDAELKTVPRRDRVRAVLCSICSHSI